MQVQDLLDHGESRKKQEEAEFARIDAEAKDERDKQMGFRGKVCLPCVVKLRVRLANVSYRSSTFWTDQTLSLLGQNQRPSMVSTNG